MNFSDGLSREAEAAPNAVAIVERDRIIHYGNLDRAVWRAAAWFRSHGIAPGQLVAISLTANSALFLVAVYALARLGAVQMLLPLREPAAMRQALARRLGVVAILAEDAAARLDGLPLLSPAAEWLDGGAGIIDDRLRHEGDDAPFKLNLSSGTTAAPKCVLRTHRAQILLDRSAQRRIGDARGDRYLAVIGFTYVVGLWAAADIINAGGMVRIARPDLGVEDVLALIDREGINRLILMPSHVHRLLERSPEDKPRLPRLRALSVGSAYVADGVRREIRRRITPNFVVTYGTSEAGNVCWGDAGTQDAFPGTVGLPHDGVEIGIVDEAGRPLAPGEVGLVRLRRAGLPTGYVDDPAATARSFRDGWFYPGDLGTLAPEGALFLKGRADDMMNHDGIKIYPVDIEITLLEHPAVLEAAAFPRPDRHYQEIPAAAVVLRAPVAMEALVDFCRERLGTRAPRWLAIVPALPKSPLGKVLKRELALTLSDSS